MSIEYKQHITPQVNTSNEIMQLVCILTGTCTESGTAASVDALWDVSDKPKKHYSLWTKEDLDAEFKVCEYEKDFVSILEHKIECKNAKAIAPQDFDYNNAPNN